MILLRTVCLRSHPYITSRSDMPSWVMSSSSVPLLALQPFSSGQVRTWVPKSISFHTGSPITAFLIFPWNSRLRFSLLLQMLGSLACIANLMRSNPIHGRLPLTGSLPSLPFPRDNTNQSGCGLKVLFLFLVYLFPSCSHTQSSRGWLSPQNSP